VLQVSFLSCKIDVKVCIILINVVMLHSPTSELGPALSYQNLANYPEYIGQVASFNGGTKNCIMCGKECLYIKKRSDVPPNNDAPCLLSRTRGVCTVCSDQVWQKVENNLQVKQCQMCCKWYPWANFQGTKGMVKQCGTCRAEQGKREEKRSQKRKEEKAKSPADGKVKPLAAGKVKSPPASGKVKSPPAARKVKSPPAAGKAEPPAAGKVKSRAAGKDSSPAAGKVKSPGAGKAEPPAAGKVEPPIAGGLNRCVALIPTPATCSR
jgi:hypothetical protein